MGNKLFKSKTQIEKENTYQNCDIINSTEINYSPLYTSKEEIRETEERIETREGKNEFQTEYFKPKE